MLTRLFPAPDRVGRPACVVTRCSCGSLSEMHSQYFAYPTRESLGDLYREGLTTAPDQCHLCRVADVNGNEKADTLAIRWHRLLCARYVNFGMMKPEQKRKPTTHEMAVYYVQAPRMLKPGGVTFNPGAFDVRCSAPLASLPVQQREFAVAVHALAENGQKHADALGPLFTLTVQALIDASATLPR